MGAPAPTPPRAGPDDVDWDDDDEVTNVYNPEAHGSFMASGPSLSSPPPTPPPPARSRPAEAPPAPRPVEGLTQRSRAEPVVAPTPVSVPGSFRPATLPPAPRTNSAALVLAALAFVLAAGVVGWFFWPRNGTLAVNVSGPGGTAIEMVSILVDEAERCTASGCRLELPEGTYEVRVAAPGFQKAAARAVVIRSGETALVDFPLVPASGSGGDAETGTGIRVGDLGAGLRLFVDGEDKGPLPAAATDLKPGDHTVRIAGSDRFQPFEEHVTVEEGSVRLLEPTLRATKGILSVVAGDRSSGSTTTLVCGNDRRLLEPPTKVEIDIEKACVVVARKAGAPEFKEDVRFDGPRAEATITVQFGGGASPPSGFTPPPGPASPPPAPPPATPPATPPPGWLPGAAGTSPPAPTTTAPQVAEGKGIININSLPVSSVLVDGRPVGQTPVRVAVFAGPHTVTFVHPEKGRKSVGVQVPAGGSTTAITRF